jgi:hypothetical protein
LEQTFDRLPRAEHPLHCFPARVSRAAFREARPVDGESGLDRSARSGLSGRDMSLFPPARRLPIETFAA